MANAAKADLIIVLPAYNEEASLGVTLDELLGLLAAGYESSQEFEVVVVDDGSRDRTREIASDQGVTILTHACNLGYGAAVSTGLLYAASRDADALIIMDADGQHDPSVIPGLLTPVLRDLADMTIGSRYVARTGYATTLSRRLGSALFGALLSVLARRRIHDTTSGFQCIGRRALRQLAETYPTDYPDAQVILQLLLSGMRVEEVPTVVRQRTAGRSMHSWTSVLRYPPRMVLAMLVVTLRWAMSRLRTEAPQDRPGPKEA